MSLKKNLKVIFAQENPNVVGLKLLSVNDIMTLVTAEDVLRGPNSVKLSGARDFRGCPGVWLLRLTNDLTSIQSSQHGCKANCVSQLHRVKSTIHLAAMKFSP